MKTLRISMILSAVILVAFVQQAPAKSLKPELTILLGTTGACDNLVRFGPCTKTSTLVELDPHDGSLIREIGPVGYTVNGLAWDGTSGKLYATTSSGDQNFHGLITIDPRTGHGKPVNKKVVNFGLDGLGSPIHSITIDVRGELVGWYEELPPGSPDSYVRIDKHTGRAVEFDTGIDTARNGLSFDEFNLLWNIDSPLIQDGTLTQTAYIINPLNGEPFVSVPLEPPTAAALGDFNPENNLYYGLDFDTDEGMTYIVVIDFLERTVSTLDTEPIPDLHTITFVKGKKAKK